MDKGQNLFTCVYEPSLKSAVMTRIVVKLWDLQFSQEKLDCQYNYDHEDDDKDTYQFCDFCINFELTDQCNSNSHHDRYGNIHYHNHDFAVRYHDFSFMEKKVMNKLLALKLPKKLEREIMRYVMHIGQTFLSWIDPQYYRLGYIDPLKYIFWTSEGTVNVSETIRSIYSHQRKDSKIFMAISNACLEDLIKEAWNMMPRYEKDIIERTARLCWDYKYDAHLVVYWLCFCKNDFSGLFDIIEDTDDIINIYDRNHSMFRNMFHLSVQTGNKLAAKYFWPKLTGEEKNANMLAWIDSLFESIEDGDDMDYNEHYTNYGRRDGFLDILFFLLSQMNDSEQQRQVFQKHVEDITSYLIYDWPWQKYLLQNISIMFSFMEDVDYIDFIGGLIYNVGKGRVIEKLFSDVWHESPLNFKMHFVEDRMEHSRTRKGVFCDLFDIHDLNNIKLIIDLTNETAKRAFIFSGIQSTQFISSAINNLDDADNFLKETLPSESDLHECKALIVKYLKNPSVKHLLQDHDKNKTEDFLKWCLVSEGEICHFKRDIALNTIGK